MLRWLFYIVLALLGLRILQARRTVAPPRRSRKIHPTAGSPDPSSAPKEPQHPAFSSVDIVDAEFEELPERKRK